MRAVIYRLEQYPGRLRTIARSSARSSSCLGRVSVLDTAVPRGGVPKGGYCADTGALVDPQRAGNIMHALLWELIPQPEGCAPNYEPFAGGSRTPQFLWGGAMRNEVTHPGVGQHRGTGGTHATRSQVTVARPSGARKKPALDSLASGAGEPGVVVEAGDYPGFMRLRCEDIDLYDRNPRTSINPRYAEIRDSIIERGGPQGPLMCTTTGRQALHALHGGQYAPADRARELWRATGEARYEGSTSPSTNGSARRRHHRRAPDRERSAGGHHVLREGWRTRPAQGRAGEATRPADAQGLGAEAKRLGTKVSAVVAMNYSLSHAVAELAPLGPLPTH